MGTAVGTCRADDGEVTLVEVNGELITGQPMFTWVGGGRRLYGSGDGALLHGRGSLTHRSGPASCQVIASRPSGSLLPARSLR